MVTALPCVPVPGCARPVAGLTNDTWPAGEPTAIVAPSGLIAAADGAVGAGVIVAELNRRTGLASNVLYAVRCVDDQQAGARVGQPDREHRSRIDPCR